MGHRTAIQILMIAAALFIVFAVIKPKLDAIKVVQDQAAEFQNAADKASEYNSELNSLISRKAQFSKQQLEDLELYLPNTIDEVAILADLKAVADISGLAIVGASRSEEEDTADSNREIMEFDENGEPLPEDFIGSQTNAVDFIVKAEGSYASLKQFLNYLSFNTYQLELVALEVRPQEKASGQESTTANGEPALGYDLVLRAYSFSS